MPYTQTSIQEEMNIIDNRPFQHSSKKRASSQGSDRQNTVNCPPKSLPQFFKLAHSSRMREWSIDSFIVIDFPLFRGTHGNFRKISVRKTI